MTVQDIKRGHWKEIDGNGLRKLMEEQFQVSVKVDNDGWHCVEYGALRPLKAKMLSKSELEVLTTSDANVSNEEARESIRRYNHFLEAATGFNSKERKKRLNKKAKEGKL